ncbi:MULTISPECIES: hypothetical protein [Pseudoalteromonas]|uniref:Uncharacterized protein n=1 Tax=Pseudoalteromonas aurantia 208 TaxID=1314867 RepID=A0ABR9E6V6_9GAMM|nr:MULTISPECIES: hypothetical protein [Pseudoalteromonas]MBE0366728.1 hypothetical protein [Pseudoalteromonas aurantia 208]MBQ4848070.1 hypothetical protein [Pseudoalteromonas sp. MMG005]
MRLLFSFLILCFSCGVVAQRYYSERYSQSDLGKGFDQELHQEQDSCVTGDLKFHSAMSGELDYLQHQNSVAISRRTFGEIHAGVNLFIVAGSVSTSINHRNSTDNLSLTSQLHLKLDEGYSTLENRSLVADYDKKACGGAFIYQLNYGRDIFINTRLHFRSEADFKRFVTKIKIRLLFFKKTITKVKLIEKYAANAVLSIDANSNASLPAGLTQLLNSNTQHCRGSDITPCLNTLQRLSDYVFGDTGFTSDLNKLKKAPRSVATRSYQDSGHYDLMDAAQVRVDHQYDHIWRSVEARFGDAVRRHTRAEAFLTIATENEYDDAQIEYDMATQNLSELSALRETCQQRPWLGECS